MKRTCQAIAPPLLLACLLSACGSGVGSGTGDTKPNSMLFTSSSPNRTLGVILLDRATDTIVRETSDLSAPSTLTSGRIAGEVDYTSASGANNLIALTSGGNALIEDSGAEYSFRFGNADMLGVAGAPATDLPTGGIATYTGTADVSVNDGTGNPTILDLTSATVDFTQSRVDVEIRNSADRWIRINAASISGTNYSGGALSASSNFATDPGTTGSLQHEGQFFETSGDELGGVLYLDRTSAGISFLAQGIYTAREDN